MTEKKAKRPLAGILTPEDIPFSPVNDLEDLPNDPHLKSVAFWSRQEHATEGTLLIPRNPLKMSASPPEITRPPPGCWRPVAPVPQIPEPA